MCLRITEMEARNGAVLRVKELKDRGREIGEFAWRLKTPQKVLFGRIQSKDWSEQGLVSGCPFHRWLLWVGPKDGFLWDELSAHSFHQYALHSSLDSWGFLSYRVMRMQFQALTPPLKIASPRASNVEVMELSLGFWPGLGPTRTMVSVERYSGAPGPRPCKSQRTTQQFKRTIRICRTIHCSFVVFHGYYLCLQNITSCGRCFGLEGKAWTAHLRKHFLFSLLIGKGLAG